MAIQMRRGNKADFDPSKMLPGEWAVAIDSDTQNQIVWMCFRAGVVKRMGTYEDFKEQIREATAEIKNEYKEEFQTILGEIEKLAEQTSENRNTVVQIRDDTVNTYLPKMLEYVKKAESSAEKAEASQQQTAESATKAQSYAVGGTGSREGEDSDNAKYYYQQAKDVSEGLKGGLQPHGTVAFADLPALSNVNVGWMYNISDEFTTTDDFNEGAGNVIPAGANIYKTSDEKWDVLAGTPVTGIKGANEDSFRRGNVVLTAKDVGAVPTGGDTAENTVKFNTASERKNLASGESHTTLFGKIAKWFADLKTVAFSGSYNDLSNKPTIPAAVAVKGNAETNYRTGNVNLTPDNIGALAKTAVVSNNTTTVAGYALDARQANPNATGSMAKRIEDHIANIKTAYTASVTTAKSCPNNIETVVNSLTIKEAGLYLIQAQTTFAKNGNGSRNVALRPSTVSSGGIGGQNTAAAPTTTTSVQTFSVSPVQTGGTTINIIAKQDSGAALNVTQSWISAIRLK